jgi:transcriptional regulator with PAS, ATPase and Fis domain
VIAVNVDGTIQFANEAAGRMYGVSRGFDAHGGEAGSVSDFPALSHLKVILEGGPQVSAELVNIDSFSLVRNTVAMRSGGEVIGAMEISHDVTRLRALEQRIGKQIQKTGFYARHCLDDIIGGSGAIEAVRKLAAVVGRDDCNVLIIGETGTGKELIAQGIHSSSNDPTRPFVAVNCAAIPGSLLESELFGYADGAFTGARKGGRPGLFELANGGTLFLDEIGEMNLEAQARRLRVLQDRMVRRIGEERMIPVSVRIIAASNADLHEGVEKGRFRRDLLYRLNVAEIIIPPLRERREDIAQLIMYLVGEISGRKGYAVEPMNPELIAMAERHPWYGNVRELRNFCERYVMYVRAGFSEDALRKALLPESGPEGENEAVCEDIPGAGLSLRDLIRREVRRVNVRCGGNVSETARCLDMDRGTVRKYLEEDERLEEK